MQATGAASDGPTGILTDRQRVQEERYVFPYHHLADWSTGVSLDYLAYYMEQAG